MLVLGVCVMVPKLLGEGISVTIGNDASVSGAISAQGGLSAPLSEILIFLGATNSGRVDLFCPDLVCTGGAAR